MIENILEQYGLACAVPGDSMDQPLLSRGTAWAGYSLGWDTGIACLYSAGLVIERLRVRIPAGAAGEFSSPELTLCVDSYSVSVPPPPPLVLPQ